MQERQFHLQLTMIAIIFAFSCFLLPSVYAEGRYAFATIHYEGTPRDEEYTLGIRVLIRSIKATGTKHDVIVLATDSVSDATRKLLIKEGAQIVPIPPIANPYKDDPTRRKYYQPRFEMTLIKLHLWNQTKYDRVVYFDADCIVLQPIDEMFKCGHFCAAYMNILAFHTAVLVVKPDAKVFQDMVNSLATMESYDGADQGFMVSYFKDMHNSRYFDPSVPSEEKMNRLQIGYSMNHIYFYEKSGWDHGYRVGRFKNLSVPALVMTYPITPIMKPWYWWTYPFMQMNWMWDQYREQLGDDWTPAIVLALLPILGLITCVQIIGLYSSPSFRIPDVIRKSYFAWTAGLLWSFITFYFAMKIVPSLMPPRQAMPLFSIIHSLLFFYSGYKFMKLTGSTTEGLMVVFKMTAVGFVKDFIAYHIGSVYYSNPVFKSWGILVSVLLYFIFQVYIIMYFLPFPKKNTHSPLLPEIKAL